jgi:membrane associated rhomboid family serine protease
MLEDRSYMRNASFEPQRSITLVLIAVNTALFVFESILSFYRPQIYAVYRELFALSPAGLAKGYVWQLFTFQFMHGGVWHLVGNIIVIYFFGGAVEETLGRKGMLRLYLSSGFIGGIAQTIFMAAMPQIFGRSVVVGASAGGFGLVAAFATMFPEREITLLLFFVLPVALRARTLLWISIGLAVFGIIVPNTGLADAAHLGGIVAGCAYIHWFVRGKGLNFSLPSFRAPRPKRELIPTASSSKGPFWQRHKPAEPDDLPPAEFISREVDPILDKISAHGIQSLTDRERRILEAARAKMAKR